MISELTLTDDKAKKLGTFIERAVNSQSVETLLHELKSYLDGFEIDVVSYQIVADDLRSVPIDHGLIFEDFPKDWIEHYIQDDLEQVDPLLEHSRKAKGAFRWFEVGEHMRLSQDQRAFLKELKATGLTDGLAVPIFSAIGDMAYFGLGVCGGTLNLSEKETAEITLACQLTHNRFVFLLPSESPTETPLSPREKDVLVQAAFGRSSSEIARQLGVTSATVETLLKRSFRKLNANSRMVAVLKAIGAGVILP